MQQVIHDTAEILDAIVNKNVKVFADNLRNVIDQSAAALRQQVQSAPLSETPPVEVATEAGDAVSEQPAVTAPSEALAQPQPAPETLG
jgi:predicted transcriptional regulator